MFKINNMIKKRLLLICFWCNIFCWMYAAPFSFLETTVTQPDGSQLTLYASGSAGANSNEYIAARLSEMGYSRPVIIPSGAEARRRMSESDFELIVVNAPLPDEFGHELCITAVEQTDAGVVFLVKAAQAEQLLAPLNEQGVLLLSKPFTTPLFLQAMHMAAAGNHRLQRLRQENARLQDKIGQLRLVSRAKCCLVEHAHMTEAEAHRYLEKQAMDTRRDRAEVAQEVLEEYADRSE